MDYYNKQQLIRLDSDPWEKADNFYCQYDLRLYDIFKQYEETKGCNDLHFLGMKKIISVCTSILF